MPKSSSSKQVSAKVACEDPHFSNLEILELQRLVDQVLESGECLSFRFKDVGERENFAMCLQIIVDGHQ
eukprot:s1165_g14.t1